MNKCKPFIGEHDTETCVCLRPNSPQAQREVMLMAQEIQKYMAESRPVDSYTLAERLWRASKKPWSVTATNQ